MAAKERQLSLIRRVTEDVSIELPEWFEHIMDAFKCPVCYEIVLIPMVYQCNNGHILCPRCHKTQKEEQGNNKCPVCREGRLEGYRNVLAETILAKLPFKKCKHKDCLFVVDNDAQEDALKAHEENCPYGRELQCVECTNKVTLAEIIPHLKEKHKKDNLICIRLGKPIQLVGRLQNDCTGFAVINEGEDFSELTGLNLFMCCKVLEDSKQFVMWVFHNRPKSTIRYKYVLSLDSIAHKKDTTGNSAVAVEENEEYWYTSVMKFNGPVLPCEATAEKVLQDSQGIIVDIDFMNGIKKYTKYSCCTNEQCKKVDKSHFYFCSLAIFKEVETSE